MFIQTVCVVGVCPSTCGKYVLHGLVGHARAMGLSMLGDKLSAGKAEQWGLIWQCVADDAFDGRLDELARHFADAPTKGLAYTKRALNQSLANSLDDQLDQIGRAHV